MRDTIKFFCSNVRGLVKNWNIATSFNWNEYDIVAFNEIWNIKDFEKLIVDGYEIKSVKLRNTTRGGGTIIFGKKNLKTEVLTTPFNEGIIETTGIKIGEVNFIQIYRPPSGNKREFIDILSEYLDNLGGQKIVLGGDFNLNTMIPNEFIQFIEENYNLKKKILLPTRIESGTCIDNFLTNMDGIYNVSNIAIADHQAITAKIEIEEVKKIKETKFKYRVMKEANWAVFKNEAFNISVEGNSIDDKWNNLGRDIKIAVEKSFPFKESNRKYTFSMSLGLLKSRDRKNLLLKKYKQGKIDKKVYIDYNRIYRKLIVIEQGKNFKGKLNEAGINGKEKWRVLKDELLLNQKNSNITEIKLNNAIVTNPTEISKTFKDHFENCATKLADNLPQGKDTSNIMRNGEIWKFSHTTEIDLLKIIRSLKSKNSSGEDGLSNRMIKQEAGIFARILKPLINESIDKGNFPKILKKANVIPVFKKGEKNNLNNYRPISLLPVMSKIFEKVLNEQITKIIDNGFIDDNQFGFRKEFSTEDAVITFIDKVENDLSQGKHVASIFIDVSKAFDSCDHKILLTKIKKTGLDETGMDLMENYLKDREQTIVVNDVTGGTFLLNIGVPQGSVLGPTLFKIYIMDLHLHTKLFCVKFADDSSFEATGKTKDELQALINSEMIKVEEWFKNNRLTLHPDKSKYIVHSKNKLVDVKIGGKTITRCGYGLQEESVCLLGVHIDENLDWKIHINKVEKKIAKGNYLLWRHGRKLNINTKKIIYESFIRCHILYCLSVWGGAKNVHLKPLNKILHKSWSKIGKKFLHVSERLSKYKILNLQDELHLQSSKLIWKWEKDKIPEALKNILKEKIDNLRGRRFHIDRKSKIGSISYRLTKIANKYIDIISTYPSKKVMIKSTTQNLLARYSTQCSIRNCFICSN